MPILAGITPAAILAAVIVAFRILLAVTASFARAAFPTLAAKRLAALIAPSAILLLSTELFANFGVVIFPSAILEVMTELSPK